MTSRREDAEPAYRIRPATLEYTQLTAGQAEHFLERGFVTLRGAFDVTAARQWLDEAWIRFGCDRNDPASWTEKRIHLSSRSRVDARTFAPAAWRAAMDLAGGQERVAQPWLWGDGFIANLAVGDDRPWQPPSAGEAGDVVLLHPYTLHATSQNVLGAARIITNPPLALRAPMNFARPDAGDFSLVEQAVLRGLGVDRLDFAPAAPRERVVPDRVRRQQARAAGENARLDAAQRPSQRPS